MGLASQSFKIHDLDGGRHVNGTTYNKRKSMVTRLLFYWVFVWRIKPRIETSQGVMGHCITKACRQATQKSSDDNEEILDPKREYCAFRG